MRGLVTDGIQEVLVSPDNETIRLVLKQGEDDFYVDLPAKNVAAMLVDLIEASEATKDPDRPVAITVADAEVGLDEAGDVLLTHENTAGAKTTYLLAMNLVVQLSALLETALIDRSGSSQSH